MLCVKLINHEEQVYEEVDNKSNYKELFRIQYEQIKLSTPGVTWLYKLLAPQSGARISTAKRCSQNQCLQRFPIQSTYSFRAFKPFYSDLGQHMQTKADQCRGSQTKAGINFAKFYNFQKVSKLSKLSNLSKLSKFSNISKLSKLLKLSKCESAKV